MLVYALCEGVDCTVGFPIKGRLAGGNFEEIAQTAWKLQNQHFWGGTWGTWRNKPIFQIVGGGDPPIPLSTRGNPAEKLLCFPDKTTRLRRTRATTLTNQLLHVLTVMFALCFLYGEFPVKLFVKSSVDDREDHW